MKHLRVRAIFLIGALIIGMINIFAQPANTQFSHNVTTLELTGKISKIEIDEKQSVNYLKNNTAIIVSLDMKLKNNGIVPIILLNKNPLCLSAEIAQKMEEFETRTGTFSSYNLAGSSDFVNAKVWNLFKRRLDKSSPPSDMTKILLPANSISYNYEFQLNLPIEKGKTNIISTRQQITLDELKKFSTGYVRLFACDLRNYGIENDVDTNKINFAKKLQRRWKNYGYLWLDKINSKPIEVNFNSIAFKTVNN